MLKQQTEDPLYSYVENDFSFTGDIFKDKI